MKQTRKIRLVFDVEVQQDTELTPEVVKRILGTYSNYSEFINDEYWQENIRQNKVMLAVLLAHPEQYRHFLLGALESAIDMMPNDFERLAGLPHNEEGSLEGILPALPPASAAYFEETIEDGIFSERTELTTFSLNTIITGIHIENVDNNPTSV